MTVELASTPETTRWEKLQRWIVLTVSTVGLGFGVYQLIQTVGQDGASLAPRMREILDLGTEAALFCIAWLIAFRAGHSRANLAIALALASPLAAVLDLAHPTTVLRCP